MNYTSRQRRLDALCIREAAGTLTKQERTELQALFVECDAEEKEALKPSPEKNQQRQKPDLESTVDQVHALGRKEQELLAKIVTNSRLSDKKQKRFDQLRRKLHAETLTQSEEIELEKLWQYVEQMNVNRLEALVKLSQKRGTDLRTTMDDLGIGKSDEVF